MITIDVPSQFNRSSMYDFISKAINEDQEPTDDIIVFNFRTLRFIEPVGATILGNLTEWLKKRNVKVKYRLPSEIGTFEALKFLDDSQYFKKYMGRTLRDNANVRTTTIPLENIHYEDSYQWFDKTIRWLSHRIDVGTASLTNIKICFQEIFNNIKDHSQESIGCVFAQHYPSKNSVIFTISDFGVGIPHNIQKLQPSLNDAQAILKATEQGFSTKSTPQNRGAGLDTLIHNVIGNNQGSVYIHSGNGILSCIYDNNQITKLPELSSDFYPGTLIEICFRTDTIGEILDFEEEFEWY